MWQETSVKRLFMITNLNLSSSVFLSTIRYRIYIFPYEAWHVVDGGLFASKQAECYIEFSKQLAFFLLC